MINSIHSPRSQRWFDLVSLGLGFIALIVLMVFLAPVFTSQAQEPRFPKTGVRR
jgi:hypothetical protein